MGASCCHRGRGNLHGLVAGHAYSLLDVTEVKDASGTVHKLAKMRNPWNVEKYTGPWSDGDSKWTDELKKQVGLVKANDGIFFMPLEDFYNLYISFSVSIYEEFKHEMLPLKNVDWTT